MALQTFVNTFAGNPLNRVSDRRTDEAWLAEKLDDPSSLAIAIWNGKPLVENGAAPKSVQIAYLRASLAGELAGGQERLAFMGLWKETAVFAVDLEGGADPAEGPLNGLGRFEDLRAVAPRLQSLGRAERGQAARPQRPARGPRWNHSKQEVS